MTETATETARLPLFYSELTPLVPERHAGLGVADRRDYGFARDASAIPLTADEFAQAQRRYPIVFAERPPHGAVALVGARNGVNDHVDASGAWREGAYVPGYLRRYPFHLLRETADSDRHVLCADLRSSLIDHDTADPDRRLFAEGGATALAKRTLDFCVSYETAMRRAREMIEEIVALELLDAAAVKVAAEGRTTRIDGFAMVIEERLRRLPEATLAGLARRGVLGVIYAHLFSLANFAGMRRA